MHQSAKDGYRSYLQAYASYSLKKIFDVNALDLAKVGKAFGFSVPPRVNVNIGGGTGGTGKSSKKRAREEDEDEEWETDDQQAVSDEEMDENGAGVRGKARRQGKERRVEMNGQKKVNKEVFRKGENSQRQKSTGVQWSR